MEIILNHSIHETPYLYSDTQYYLQPNRKLAVIEKNYKYIYNRKNKTEELYDLCWDPSENVNLLVDRYYDRNRFDRRYLEKMCYYPYWENAEEAYAELKKEKERIWRNGNWTVRQCLRFNDHRKRFMASLLRKGARKTGRWRSMPEKILAQR